MNGQLSINTDIIDGIHYPGYLFPSMREAGFTSIHWCQDWNNERLYTDAEISTIVNDMRLNDLSACDLHASHGSKQYPLLSVSAKERSQALELLQNRMILIRAMGGDTVVFHLNPSLVFDCNSPSALVMEVMGEMQQLCAKHACRIAFENLTDVQSFNTAGLIPFVTHADTDCFGFCFDTGHANLTGYAGLDSEEFLNRLFTIHLSDNFGKRDDHLIPGEAKVDWTQVMDIIKRSSYKGPLTLEISHPKSQPTDKESIRNYIQDAYAAGVALLTQYGLPSTIAVVQ
jgi:sugar phosphate isomerase/epimerase